MHKHTHNCATCSHSCLHHCSCCNKVYCCKCGQEWGNSWYYNYPYTITYPYITSGGTTWQGDTTVTFDATCSHSH